LCERCWYYGDLTNLLSDRHRSRCKYDIQVSFVLKLRCLEMIVHLL
jgi:hypothetical protein